MDSALKTVNRSQIGRRPSKTTSITTQIIEKLKTAPNVHHVNALLDDLLRKYPQPFRECFESKSRLSKLISQVPNQDFILPLLKRTTLDLNQIRSSIEQRITTEYLQMQPELWLMSASQDQSARENLGGYNLSKVEDIYKCIIKPLKIPLPAEVLMRWVVLAPVQPKSPSAAELLSQFVKLIVAQQAILNFDTLFDLASSDLIGSSNLSLVIELLTINSRSLAETLLQYSLVRNRNAGKVLKGLSNKIKSGKVYNLAELTVSRAVSRGYVLVAKDIFVSFVVPVLLADLPSSKYYQDGSNVVKELLSQPQLKLNGVLSKESADWLIVRINRQNMLDHMCLLQTLFKKTMSEELAKHYHNHLEKYIDQCRKGEFGQQQQPLRRASTYDGGVGSISQQGSPRNQRKCKTTKLSTIVQQTEQQNSQVKIHLQCRDFIGLPNIGNTCYINSFLSGLFFCRAFTQTLLQTEPKDLTLQWLRVIFHNLQNKDPTKLKSHLSQMRKQLPVEFNSDIQQDTMEFGRCIVDKISAENQFKSLFELRSEQTITCPKGDVIERRQCKDYFMILSFEQPQLFSKLTSSGSSIFTLGTMLQRDYFTPTDIQGTFECSSSCKLQHNRRQRRQRIISMPNILIVVLSRFSYDLKQKIKRKVCDRVAIDNWLVFGNLTSSQKQDNYKLVAFINHMGSNAESGHYQTHVRHPFVEDKWLNFDDEFVTESVYSKAKDLIENFNQYDTPYVLFFSKI